MGDWHPIPTTPGLAVALVGVDMHVGQASVPVKVTEVFLRRTDESGALVAQLRNAGGDSITVTFGAAAQSATGTGSVSFAAGEPVLLRVTSADATSQNLGGSFALAQSSAATTFLTTLALVKSFLGVTASTHDALINELLPGVSKAIQNAIGRDILQQTITAEVHESPGRWKVIAAREFPILTLLAVRENDVALTVATEYRLWQDWGVQRLSGSATGAEIATAWAHGFVEFDYDAGFASVPSDLEMIATAETAHAFKQTSAGGSRLGQLGQSVVGNTDAPFPLWDLLPMSQRVVSRYRRGLI